MVSRATAIATATITGAGTAAVAVTPVLTGVTITAGATVTTAVVASMIPATPLLRCGVAAPPVAEHGIKKRRIACAKRPGILRRPSKCGAEQQLEHIASEKNQQDAAAVYQQ